MRNIIACLLAMSLVACTSFVKTEAPATDLQRDIRSGQVIVPGDEIRVTTGDGSSLELTVTRVSETAIEGEGHSIPIDEVSALEIRRLSPERTVAVTAGSMLVTWWLIGLLLSAIVVFPG